MAVPEDVEVIAKTTDRSCAPNDINGPRLTWVPRIPPAPLRNPESHLDVYEGEQEENERSNTAQFDVEIPSHSVQLDEVLWDVLHVRQFIHS